MSTKEVLVLLSALSTQIKTKDAKIELLQTMDEKVNDENIKEFWKISNEINIVDQVRIMEGKLNLFRRSSCLQRICWQRWHQNQRGKKNKKNKKIT